MRMIFKQWKPVRVHSFTYRVSDSDPVEIASFERVWRISRLEQLAPDTMFFNAM